MPSRTSELLFEEQHPVRRLALDSEAGMLWAAITSSTVQQWHVPNVAIPPPTSPTKHFPDTSTISNEGGKDTNIGSEIAGAASSVGAHQFSVGPSPLLRQRQKFDTGTLHIYT